MEPLLVALSGAVGATLLGLIGAWIARRSEHAKWVRQERLSAYREELAVIQRRNISNIYARVMAESGSRSDYSEDTLTEWATAQAGILLVGPDAVYEASKAMRAAMTAPTYGKYPTDEQDEEIVKTRAAFVAEVRKVVGFDS